MLEIFYTVGENMIATTKIQNNIFLALKGDREKITVTFRSYEALKPQCQLFLEYDSKIKLGD